MATKKRLTRKTAGQGVRMPEKFAQQMDQISGSRPVYPMDDETFADVAAELPGFPDEVCNASRLQSALAHLSPQQLQVTTSG